MLSNAESDVSPRRLCFTPTSAVQLQKILDMECTRKNMMSQTVKRFHQKIVKLRSDGDEINW